MFCIYALFFENFLAKLFPGIDRWSAEGDLVVFREGLILQN